MTYCDAERFGARPLPPWLHHEHRARWAFAASFVEGKTVADCACGVGEGAYLFAQRGAVSVHAFDVSDEALAATRQRCAEYPNVEVVRANGTALPLEDESVQVFVSLETIEHIEAAEDFISEVARVLTADGLFVCSTPNRRVTMPGKTLATAPWNPFHVREYDPAEFADVLGRRFSTIEWFGQNPRRDWRTALMGALGALLPGHAGGRINSALKLPRFLHDTAASHAVVPQRGGFSYEYMVAVCKRPDE